MCIYRSIVNVILFSIWYYDGGGFPCFLFVVLFWGLGVAANGLTLFRHFNYFERMADSEYQKMLNRNY